MKPSKTSITLLVFMIVGHLVAPTATFAITAELAKKCRLMAVQAHPTKLAGTKNTGVEAAQRAYFGNCISKEGKMDGPDSNQSKTAPTDSDGSKMPSDISAPATVPPR